MNPPLISICIPAYKRIDYLQKLLQSISMQSFKDFEVIITDDSPDDTVEKFVRSFTGLSNIQYFKNQQVFGTPENWNESIRKAQGTWIKLMHDDDWFADKDSLKIFYEYTLKHADCCFFFSAYNNVFDKDDVSKEIRLDARGQFLLKESPLNLFKKQYVGNPSCTLIKRDVSLFYDSDFKWVVDFEYYIRCLNQVKSFCYIDRILINVGVNEDQVTKFTFRKPEVEIPENHLMIQKMGFGILRNIFVYDHFWRLYRNLEVRNESMIASYYPGKLHPLLLQMIHFQKRVPVKLLKIGIISKVFMTANYIVSLGKKV
ncbi:MAG: glycosyltransferase [Ginsengibacter sp.]|jgi:glycosyltransferase involved in cell wall biosynthesis